MATIDSLPDEMLEEVFAHACDDLDPDQFQYYLEPPYEEPDDDALPFQHRLLQVCRRWNAIVSASTRLWSSISVRAPGKCVSPRQIDNMHRFVHAAVQRTKTALFDIRLMMSMSADPRFWDVLSPVLLPQSHRWRCLNLDFPTPLTPDDFAILRGRLPNLEWLRLESFRSLDIKDNPEIHYAVSQMVQDAPKLRKLECGFQHLELKFRWDQIQELALDVNEANTPLPFWNHFCQAVTSTSLLKLTIWGWHSITGPPNGVCLPIRCPNIQEFRHCCSPQWPALLELPALRKTEFFGIEKILAFTDLIQQSNCTLTTLEIGMDIAHQWWSAQDLKKLLELYGLLPCLTSLTLNLCTLDPLVEHMNPLLPIVSHHTLPSLTVLRMDWSPRRGHSATLAVAKVLLPALTAIIKSHRPALRSVWFGYNGEDHPVDWATLEKLEAFENLGSCEEIYRMNCWKHTKLGTGECEYSLVPVNSA